MQLGKELVNDFMVYRSTGSGKTTLCREIKKRLNGKVINFDGDDIRDVLNNKDYSEKGRRKNIQFVINMAKVMEKKGFLVLVSLVSPYRDLRIGEVIYLNSSRDLRKEYWVKITNHYNKILQK